MPIYLKHYLKMEENSFKQEITHTKLEVLTELLLLSNKK